MPNMLDDGLLSQAWVVRKFSDLPTNADFVLQSYIAGVINAAAATGLYTVTVSVASYSNTLVQLLIQRLINMGYVASMPSANNLTVTWSSY